MNLHILVLGIDMLNEQLLIENFTNNNCEFITGNSFS